MLTINLSYILQGETPKNISDYEINIEIRRKISDRIEAREIYDESGFSSGLGIGEEKYKTANVILNLKDFLE